MHTPKIADYIFKKKNSNRPHRPFYNHLGRDGVHAKPETDRVWENTLHEAITINRQPPQHTSTTTTADHPDNHQQQIAPAHNIDTDNTQDRDEHGEPLDYMSDSDSDTWGAALRHC